VVSHGRGEVWLVDLGMAAKTRPCLILSVPFADVERALVTLVPHTTHPRPSRFDVEVPLRFLSKGAFYVQGLVTVPSVKLIRRLGALTPTQLGLVEDAVSMWLGLTQPAAPAAP